MTGKMLLQGPKLTMPSNEKPYNDDNGNLIQISLSHR